MYVIKEIFATLQGEGHHAGTPAVFVRFAGCNMWSGSESTRSVDASRNAASCALWCDTDFVGGDRMGGEELAKRVVSIAQETNMLSGLPLIVFTGGEPLLQLDAALLTTLRLSLAAVDAAPKFAIETNGRTELSVAVRAELDWVCVSPKGSPEQLIVHEGDELKVIYPAYHPEDFERSRGTLRFAHWYLQAEATPLAVDGTSLPVGETRLQAEVMQTAAAYCMRNPSWKLSVQIHKVIDRP